MIKFKSCKWKNFLSTGNDAIEIRLDKSPTTLIVGQNGAGKSTLLDAMSFGLFGKPHRDIGKYQLINSINGKQCIVEVDFEIGTSEFKIVRGIKPNITFILKVSSSAAKKRLLKRKTKNRYDNFSQSFYTKAQNSFLKIAKKRKNRRRA